VGKIDGKIQINCFDTTLSSNLSSKITEAEVLYEELIANRFVDPIEYEIRHIILCPRKYC
jgi:hypothetical protein